MMHNGYSGLRNALVGNPQETPYDMPGLVLLNLIGEGMKYPTKHRTLEHKLKVLDIVVFSISKIFQNWERDGNS